MGIEAFGVSMNFVQVGVYEKVKTHLIAYQQVHLEAEQSVSGYNTVIGEYSDGSHFIGIQLSQATTQNKCTLAARFSLCSYDSVDAIFVRLVNDVLSSFEAEVWLMTSALKQKAHYLPGDTAWLVSALPEEIVAMRDYWQRSFGKKQGCVRVEDSFSFVGLKAKN